MRRKRPSSKNTVAFQGYLGAYSHLAALQAFPKMTPLPCPSFEETFAAVKKGLARLALIPIDNSLAGRVTDIHHLLPDSGVHIVGEHFERIENQLLGTKDAKLSDIREVLSHAHALGQCRKFITRRKLRTIVHTDTAGAAAEVAERRDRRVAAIASKLAAKIYGLKILKRNIEDAGHNTTRFIIIAREPVNPDPSLSVVTSLVFRVRNIPAALYKAIGGFATNGVNFSKLESYILNGKFAIAQFYAEIEGHPASRPVRLAFQELRFYTKEFRILGVFPASPYRKEEKRLASVRKTAR
ncbi:prephenate dehydratase [Candidatus Kaiserbacteria bacterium]|nr:prephenate dehydratase [Candidatus Kaiserbacteria bacterium]